MLATAPVKVLKAMRKLTWLGRSQKIKKRNYPFLLLMDTRMLPTAATIKMRKQKVKKWRMHPLIFCVVELPVVTTI